MSIDLNGSSWLLSGPLRLPDGVDVTIEFGHDSVSGCSGCNRFHGPYRHGEGEFTVGPLAGTMMAGSPAVGAGEHAVLRRLGRVVAITVTDDGGSLSMHDADGVLLLAYTAQGSDDLAGRWLVTSVHHSARQAIISVLAESEPTLEFDGDRVVGSTGCNTLRGTCTVDGSTLGFGPLMTTRKWCGDEAMAQEQALLAALADTVGFRLEGSRLTLLRPDGGIAVSLRRGD